MDAYAYLHDWSVAADGRGFSMRRMGDTVTRAATDSVNIVWSSCPVSEAGTAMLGIARDCVARLEAAQAVVPPAEAPVLH